MTGLNFAGRKQAEEINEIVLYWSVFESFAFVLVAIMQVMILKAFFIDKSNVRVG